MLSKKILCIAMPFIGIAGCVTEGPAKQHEVIRLDFEKPPITEPEKPMPVSPALVSVVQTKVVAAPAVAAVEMTPAERFLSVYKQVGSPQFVVYVNRIPDGKLIQSTFKTSPSPAPSGTPAPDTGGIETRLAKAMSYDQQTTVIPREKIFEELSSGELASLQGGDVKMLAVLGEKLKAHVLIQAQVAAYEEGGKEKLLVQAVNVGDGVVLAKTSVSMDDTGDYIQKAADDISRGLASTWTTPR